MKSPVGGGSSADQPLLYVRSDLLKLSRLPLELTDLATNHSQPVVDDRVHLVWGRAVGLRRHHQGENILRLGNAEAQSTTMSSKPQGVHVAVREISIGARTSHVPQQESGFVVPYRFDGEPARAGCSSDLHTSRVVQPTLDATDALASGPSNDLPTCRRGGGPEGSGQDADDEHRVPEPQPPAAGAARAAASVDQALGAATPRGGERDADGGIAGRDAPEHLHGGAHARAASASNEDLRRRRRGDPVAALAPEEREARGGPDARDREAAVRGVPREAGAREGSLSLPVGGGLRRLEQLGRGRAAAFME